MSYEEALSFAKFRESVEYDRTKNSTSKRSKSFKNDLIKRVDKVLNISLALPVNEYEGKRIVLQSQRLNFIFPSSITDF